MSTFDIRFLNRAIELADENIERGCGGPLGAVVVKGGNIIAEGANHVTTHNDPTAHAEVVAIRKACEVLNDFQLLGCDIYCSCEPCPMCLGAIYWARARAIYYAATKHDAAKAGFDDSFIYEEINVNIENRQIIAEYHPHPYALEVFDKWGTIESKTKY